jgi:broad specificity phosphatase PhoE
MGRQHLYLARHGQQAAPGRVVDNLGNGLTRRGQQQARHLARRLSAALSDVRGVVIHHSTMRRAAETAAFVAAQLSEAPLRPTRVLWEIPAVSVPADFAHWFTRFTPEQIARGQAQAERAYRQFCRPARGRDRHAVIVCHGNLIRYFVTRVLNLPGDAWINLETDNAGLTELIVDADGRVRLLSFNDVGHLPARLRSFI